MQVPKNLFKSRLKTDVSQLGLWCSLPGAYGAEVAAVSGFDWLLFDTEHSPGDPLTVLAQLQATAPYSVSPVVRPASNDEVLIKRFLDIGVQSLLIPQVNSAADARRAVAATRYPPTGVRGVSRLTRATGFGRYSDYAQQASEQICLLVQVESKEAMREIEAICEVDGIDGVFIGPSDLAASLGHVGNARHDDVCAAVEDGLRRIRSAGCPAGILTTDTELARHYISIGSNFTAIAVDIDLLLRSSAAVLAEVRR